MAAVLSRALAAITSRIPAPDCCPYPDPSEDPDAAYLPADLTRHDYGGSTQ